MANIDSLIANSEKLTNIFGYWPSFHDAEILELHLWRGNIDTQKGIYNFPVLTLKVHVWEMTREVDQNGHFVHRHQTLVTLRFRNVEDLHVEGFNHQNAIFALSIAQQARDKGPSPYFSVELEPAFGIASSFKCFEIEVVEAVAWTDEVETHRSLFD